MLLLTCKQRGVNNTRITLGNVLKLVNPKSLFRVRMLGEPYVVLL